MAAAAACVSTSPVSRDKETSKPSSLDALLLAVVAGAVEVVVAVVAGCNEGPRLGELVGGGGAPTSGASELNCGAWVVDGVGTGPRVFTEDRLVGLPDFTVARDVEADLCSQREK